MFKNIFKKLGFGNAKVDARLRGAVQQGGVLEGDILITGSDDVENIDELFVRVVTEYKKQSGDSYAYYDCKLAEQKLFDRFTVQPREQKSLPFRVQIPFETPVTTLGYNRVYLQTTLETSAIFDPNDTDPIQVVPHPFTQRMLQAIQNIGFSLFKVDCEYTHRFGGRFPFVQEFEFKPTGGDFRGRLDELEAYIRPNERGVDVTFQIDKRGGFSELFGTDESYAGLQLSENDLRSANLEMNLRQFIGQRMGGRSW
jgi:sporulation-control protein